MDMKKRIRAYIDSNGLKLNYVAKASGIEEKRFYNLMAGTTRITFEDYSNICKGLDLGPEYFFKDKFLDFKNKEEKVIS